MIYLLCILLPPLAVLLKEKPGQALFNCLLTLLVWIPGMIHAILVVNKADTDKRHRELMRATRGR